MRAQQAFQEGHISGARHFDAAQIAAATDALKKYKERPLIVYCDRGTAAAATVRTLTQQGFTKVFNLRGGIAPGAPRICRWPVNERGADSIE